MSANFSDRQLPFSAYSTLNCRRPARSVTGRENASAWASVCIPAFSIMAFMMGFRVSAEARIKISAQNPEAFYIYGFLLALWIFRVAVAIIYPCPPESNVWMSYGQFGGSVIVFLLLLVPFIRVAATSKNGKT